jgi:hypothetical protein
VASNGAVLTSWFGVGDRAAVRLAPLIGGGVAVADAAGWHSVVASGSDEVSPPPAFLSQLPSHAISIVRDGHAYAAYPANAPSFDAQVELFSASGKRCGAVALLGAAHHIFVGREGTVVKLGTASNGGCTATWWRSLLR